MKIKDFAKIMYGKNQSQVIDLYGKYPIYGTGGIFGWANNYLYDKPSVLIGRKGTINNPIYVDNPFWTVDTLFYTIIDNSKVIPRWFYYYLCTIDLNKFNEGTTIPSLTTKTLYELEVPDYSIEYQQHIVDIIGSIDDKIENNNKIIENLKQVLYLETRKIINTSTSYLQLENIIEESKEKIKSEQIPYSVINTGDVVIQTEKFSKRIAKDIVNKYKIIKKNWFVYNPSRINIGSIGIMKDDIGCVSPIYIVFKVQEKYINYVNEIINFDNIKLEFNKKSSGSVRQALSFDSLSSIVIPGIDDLVLNKYNVKYNKINILIENLKKENTKLNKLKQNYLLKFF